MNQKKLPDQSPHQPSPQLTSRGDKDGGVAKSAVLKAIREEKNNSTQHYAESLWQATAHLAEVYFQNNPTDPKDINKIIQDIFESLTQIKRHDEKVKAQSVVSVEQSLTPDYIICLEDGKKLKMLKRHLRAHFNMSPHEYRAKWGLPPDYPMVAPNYANVRSQFAKKQNFGKSSGAKKSSKTNKHSA